MARTNTCTFLITTETQHCVWQHTFILRRQELDISFNKKCYTQELADLLAKELPTVAVRITVTFPPPPGAYVGEAACNRDASLLRSQLEPYTTLQLRRRLVTTFGYEQQ